MEKFGYTNNLEMMISEGVYDKSMILLITFSKINYYGKVFS